MTLFCRVGPVDSVLDDRRPVVPGTDLTILLIVGFLSMNSENDGNDGENDDDDDADDGNADGEGDAMVTDAASAQHPTATPLERGRTGSSRHPLNPSRDARCIRGVSNTGASPIPRTRKH
ncbi:hypothetical protein SPRG_14041 [Saprolegnia parasitica CBS 223.65]|uniref:Uncharacterized protein n=1 Tax=Saprolegnia parasitica (strain CBS 223.65) TaxID=695850 RepID=A0A067BVS4_SAPPC|nr:hypothetical protein SPRG_14041 [Saprolegnia parasitica CBS 223.65]KDO20950.1 hypothetical protein SPRG_14041 [Saprolegnia parasitica CBS 223.65]|eukprot:XP_012208341.1 hypothetical protein SPRG_14041 [Saprolegnia parasitica CBS 223.65]